MTLTIDDGTFEVGNSFVTLEEAETFCTERGYTDWTGTDNDANKETALTRTFDFLSVQNWISTAFDSGVPTKIKYAQILGAIKELASIGALQPDVTPNVKSESIAGAIETEYFEGGGYTQYTAVENMIRPYLVRPGVKTRIVLGGGAQS